MISKSDELAKPADLSADGEEAYRVLVDFLRRNHIADTGGCKAFYSPVEWKRRKEKYGRDGVLIVVYDGGAHRQAFTLDEEQYDLNEQMQQELKKLGMYFEECTGWYGCVCK